MNDLKRANELGMTLDEFQALVGHDPLDRHTQFLIGGVMSPKDVRKVDDEEDIKLNKKNKKNKSTSPKSYHAEADGKKDALDDIGEKLIPFETDTDVNNKNANEIEHFWTRPVTSDEDKALYYGFHIHSKDNVYGLHAHYPGGPLSGGHLHGAQNRLGYHTHRYSPEELLQFKFARPGIMVQLDGPHEHQCNAPDGSHIHNEENFGPASDSRAQDIAARNLKTDTN